MVRCTRIGLLVAVVMLSGALGACAAAPGGGSAPPVPAQQWTTAAASLPASDYRILVLGGSNSEGTATQQTAKSRWHDLVAARRAARLGTTVTRVRYNGAVTGTGRAAQLDNSYSGVSAVSMAAYPERSVAADVRANELWVLLGSNDEIQRATPSNYGAAITTLIRRYNAPQCTVIAPWANGTTGFYLNHPAHSLFVDAARQAAAGNGCRFVEMDALGSANSTYGIGDGVHLSTSGHAALADLVGRTLGV